MSEGWPEQLPAAVLLTRLERDLRRITRPVPLAGADLQAAKRELARRGYGGLDMPRSLGGAGHSALLQALAQFTAGFEDLDLRDAVHIGHGRIPLLRGAAEVRARWQEPLIQDGKLAGLLATEPTGGTALHKIDTELRPRGRDRFILHGAKSWVSRIQEASLFTVFARDPQGNLNAAIVPADRPGITVEAVTPAGLAGWSWGRVRLHRVEVAEAEVLPDAREAWDEHFDYYRPLVGATALGGAAAYWNHAADFTRQRQSTGHIARPRDTALETLGQTENAIRRALLDVLHATIAVERRTPNAGITARSAKAAAVETARWAVDQLAALLGAAGFQNDSRPAKIARDIAAYRYADGHNDELMRSAGRALLDRTS